MGETDKTVTATKTSLRIVESLKRLDGAGVTDVANELELPKSTVHNHLVTLVEAGYVTRRDGDYRIGLRFLELGEHTRNAMKLYELARSEIVSLADATGELSNAAVEEHGEGVYITRAEGDNAVTTDTYAGKRIMLHCTALGKAILAHLPEGRVEDIVATHGLPRRTENTITDISRLESELEEVRDRGVAFDREERLEGLRCVAAPILTPDGDVGGALSVSGPSRRLQGERFREDVPEMLLSSANVIELNLTHS